MKTEYTPGPWSVTLNRIHGEVGSGANQGIADMLGNCGVTATVNANARLIAAAPELLQAVKDLLKMSGGPDGLEWSAIDPRTVRQAAVSAIAKATA